MLENTYNNNQYYGETNNEEYSEARDLSDIQLALGGTFGSGIETVHSFWKKMSRKASRAIDR